LLDDLAGLIEANRIAEPRFFSDLPVLLLEPRYHSLHVLYWTYQAVFRFVGSHLNLPGYLLTPT